MVVTDENWKQDKFDTVYQGNNFTLDFLNAGEQYIHECAELPSSTSSAAAGPTTLPPPPRRFTVVPKKTISAHKVKPAKMVFVDGVEGENTITHHSNSWGIIQIEPGVKMADLALKLGQYLTFNTIKTKKGWMLFLGLVALFALVQLYYIGSAILQKRRHLRALDDVKKM